MKTFDIKKFLVLFFLVLGSVSIAFGSEPPEWMVEGFSIPGYVHGIGRAEAISPSLAEDLSELDATEELLEAVDSYLSELVGGEPVFLGSVELLESNGYSSSIRKIVINGIEVSDRWTDDKNVVWTLCILNKLLLPEVIKSFAEKKKEELSKEIEKCEQEYIDKYSAVLDFLKELKDQTESQVSMLELEKQRIDPNGIRTSLEELITREIKQNELACM